MRAEVWDAADVWAPPVSGSGAGAGGGRMGAGPAAVLGHGPRGRAGGSEGLGQKERVPTQKERKSLFLFIQKGLNQIC